MPNIKTMSESPKMGLFGSKDKTKEGKTEVKDDSPDRYAPYCIDSDSETYDTEALSIMDINDIIGVQSEPVSDSTLESEIAALSQIITESKSDVGQNVIEDQSDMQQESISKNREDFKSKSINPIQTSDTQQYLKSTLDSIETSDVDEVKSTSDMEQTSDKDSQSIKEDTFIKDMDLKNQQESNDTKDNCEHSVSIDSVDLVNTKNNENSDVSFKVDININQPKHKHILQTTANKGNVNTNVKVIENETSICGSLQLIGEAYSSEDSQEMRMDDIESMVTDSSCTVNVNNLIPNEEKKETHESLESENAVNNTSEISNVIDLGETCTDKDIPIENIENNTNVVEVDLSNCFTQSSHSEEVSNISDKIEIHTDCTVDKPKDIVLECETEETAIDAMEVDEIKEEALEERKIIDENVKEEDAIVECTEMEIKQSTESNQDLDCLAMEKLKTEAITDNIEIQESEESMDVEEKEGKSEECMDLEEKRDKNEELVVNKTEVNQEEDEDTNVLASGTTSNENFTILSSTECDKINMGIAETTQRDDKEKIELAQFKSENIINPNTIESSNIPCINDNTEVMENKTDAAQVLEETDKINSEELSTMEEINTKKLETTTEGIEVKQLENAEEMNIENLEDTKETNIEELEATNDTNTGKMKTTEEIIIEKLETIEKMDIKQGGIAEEMNIEKIEIAEETIMEKQEIAEEISTEKQETAEEISTKKQETAEEISTEKQETAEEISTEKQETAEEMNTEKQESAEEMNTEKQESAEEMNTEKQESAEEINTEEQETAEEISIEKLETTEEINMENVKTTEEINMENVKTTKEINMENVKTTEEINMKNVETTEEINMEKLENTEEINMEKLENSEEINMEKLKNSEEVNMEKLENSEEINMEKLENSEEINMEKLEKLGTTEEMDIKQLEITDKEDTNQLETTKEINIEKFKIEEEMDVENSETTEKINSEKSETVEELNTETLSTSKESDTKPLEIAEVMDIEQLKTEEDIDIKHLEGTEEIDINQLETTKGIIDTEQLETTTEVVDTKQLETTEELDAKQLKILDKEQEGSEESSFKELLPIENNQNVATSNETSKLELETNVELPSQSVSITSDTVNVEKLEINTDMEIQGDNNLDHMLPEVVIKESLVESEEAIELPVSETTIKDEVEMCVSQKSDTTSLIEVQMVMEVNEDLTVQSEAISDITTPLNTNTTEDNCEVKIDATEANNYKEKEELEVIKTEPLPINKFILDEQNVTEMLETKEGLTEVQNIEETKKNEAEETVNEIEVFQECTESKDLKLSEESTDTIIENKENFSPKIVLQQEETMECETSDLKIPEENYKELEENMEESKQLHVKGTVETNVDMEKTETKDFDSNSISKDLFLLSSTEPVVSEEHAEDEDTEEEMNLTLEPEETESQTAIYQDNFEQKVEESNVGDDNKEDEQTYALEKEDASTGGLLEIEKYDSLSKTVKEVRNLDNIDDSVLNKNIQHKEQVESNNLKSDADGNNFKDILDSATTVEEMFSEEQNDNTEDIVTSILDDVRSATDFKNILTTETDTSNEIVKVLEESANLPLVETAIDELTEKLPETSESIINKEMQDSISTQNIDSLEGLLGLDLIQEREDSTLKTVEPEKPLQEQERLSKDVDMGLLLEQSNQAADMEQASDYITDVISSCLTGNDTVSIQETTKTTDLTETSDDKVENLEASSILKVKESTISESISPSNTIQNLQKALESGSDLPENELDMEFEEAPLGTADELEETETKLDLDSDMLLANEDNSENLNNAPTIETSQPSSEISELESAVKFLQESEEQAIDSPLILSPKMVERVVDGISKETEAAALFVPDEDMCEDTELVEELQNIATDSISISEAEIISEAAKLESEKKLAEQVKLDASRGKFDVTEEKLTIEEEEIKLSESEVKFDSVSLQNVKIQQTSAFTKEKIPETLHALPLKTSEIIPKVSILEERLKEPPKIEIPSTDVTKVTMSPTASKDSLLIQKDAKLIAFQKMLESPKLSEKTEPKIMETPRKDSEKHDFENVGSPRIILKIAKSAIADCAEPRSPKSPKIRSATNSPNPEDSPGQKLGKIKLKLSKGGHPSIISNENIEEVGQWYSEGTLSLSPIGMKIKLSKSGDASIVSSDKHEFSEDSKEGKHKFEEIKRTESPIGMKIKLSKSGDASIVQQDTKDMQIKHKDKLDMVQGSPKRTESPIGMKIKLSKSGDVSIIQTERQDTSEEHRETQMKPKEASYDSPKRTDSPIGMKIKLSKTGDASIVSPDMPEENRESKMKDKIESPPEIPKRTDSPIGMKIKLAKTKGGASIIPMETPEDTSQKLEIPDIPKRTESPLGMKIKLSKSGDASIVHSEVSDESKDIKLKEKVEAKEKPDAAQDVSKTSDSSGMKIKVIKSGDISVIAQECSEESEISQESLQKVESPIGMKIKLSKFGDPSIIPTEKQEQPEESKASLPETPKRTESPIGMKIKLSRTGDASIIQSEITTEDVNKPSRASDTEHSKVADAALGMKIKLLKTGDASIVDPEKKERQQRRRDTESPLEMKIKLSKTGHPTIVACDNHGETTYRAKEAVDQHGFVQRYKEQTQTHKETTLKFLKTGHSSILQSNRSELTIEPVQMQGKKPDSIIEISPKRKDITVAPIESKKSKIETQLTQILPEVTIQPVTSRNQKQFMFDPKSSSISLQQMNVISQEISITQVRPSKPQDTSMSDKLKDILIKNSTSSPMNSDCEIIEHRPELIIVNENSNSSQDVMIIEEVSPTRLPEVKVPKKRGRPRRNPLVQPTVHPPPHMLMSRDPLSLDETQQMQHLQAPQMESRENERPKRTCRSQKSYAPPKRGRGRGRGKRKLDGADVQIGKKPRIEQDLTAIEASTTAVITIDCPSVPEEASGKSPELYKVLKQPAVDAKLNSAVKIEKKGAGQKNDASMNVNVSHSILPDSTNVQVETKVISEVHLDSTNIMPKPVTSESKDNIKDKKLAEVAPERMQKTVLKQTSDEKSDKTAENTKPENKDMLVPPGHQNWLTPSSKRPPEATGKHENVSTVQVIDEETRMSAESGSRSQTPARNISAPASETMVNEESQGSVLSTATTESEKVKVKNRRMEINFDPDEGPFTVDKIAEYEWPLDRKGETFMIQEQISQYLGVKSFKRKYPDLKRRVVDMEERNYLRENGLVSEGMCDMGLTAICSSEVLDVMCSDFPDQYEEYRKHMREKQVKEHSKKQKELSAAANAEKNRIDLAEMAVQSALSWNISLNKARRENRKCSLDLQTFTIHVPKKQQKVETERKIGHYPVALIPGQYTDYYREYTPAELRYYPLNTVLYGPMRPNERKFDSQSEGSQSDSDSDSSSDDSSSSSSEGTQDTEGSQSTMDDVDMEIVNQKEEVKLKCKMCLKALNKHSKNEVLVQCGTCSGHVHPSCIDLTLDMVPHIQSYAWQCTDCKTCAQCHDPADEDKMLFCDMCDRGYHIYCVGLRRVPQGRWHCQECAVCANCGSREPGGANSDRNSVAQWQHEYKKGDKNTRVYVSTLCVPCSKLWRKGRYCPHCSRCHTAPRLDLEANLVHCSACDKYLHLGCVETKGVPLDRKNYLCDFCAPNRQQMVKPLVSKTLRM
nr:uncharacterized protein LOC116428381 isoform X3 [Nomia melanderi]